MLLVLDNFLEESDPLLSEVQSDKFWEDPLKFTFLEKDREPLDLWQKLVTKIWAQPYVQKFLPNEYDGTEYWTNIISTEEKDLRLLPWHIDKDEYINSIHINAGNDEGFVTPYIGSVYYAHKSLPIDGYLEISRGKELGDIERIQPVPNRLVIFDSSVLHRVLPVESGIRRCFATNIWINKPSEENFTT